MREGLDGRDFALLAGGLALGIVASRLLPPVLAMGSGAARAAATGDPFSKLENDHRMILSGVESMEQNQSTDMAKRMAQFLAVKRKLAKHAMAEEDVVYPLMSDEGQRREAAKHLYEEHARIKMLLFEIETAIMDGQTWSGPVARLRNLLESHIRDEEQEEFPRLRQMLQEQRYKQVGAQVHREEAMIL